MGTYLGKHGNVVALLLVWTLAAFLLVKMLTPEEVPVPVTEDVVTTETVAVFIPTEQYDKGIIYAAECIRVGDVGDIRHYSCDTIGTQETQIDLTQLTQTDDWKLITMADPVTASLMHTQEKCARFTVQDADFYWCPPAGVKVHEQKPEDNTWL